MLLAFTRPTCIPSDLGAGTTAELEEERRLLYIHGVGDPEPDQIKTNLERSLRLAGLEGEIHEFNWNFRLPYRTDFSITPDEHGWSKVNFLSLRLADACLVDCPSARTALGRWLWNAHYLAFQLAEWLYAILLSTAAIVLPALFMMGPVDQLGISKEQLGITISALTLASRALLVVIGLSAAFSIISAIVEKCLSPVRVAARRIGLLLLRPFILSTSRRLRPTFGRSAISGRSDGGVS